MKKIVIMITAVLMLLSFAACAGSPSASASGSIEGSLEEIMAKVYEGVDVEYPAVMNMEINADNVEYMFGTSDVEYKEALASEALVSAQAHSVSLIRLNSADDAQDVMDKIKANADPRKWICVGVEEEDVALAAVGDLVIFVMAPESEVYIESFLALAE